MWNAMINMGCWESGEMITLKAIIIMSS